jgi:hypothetical protein
MAARAIGDGAPPIYVEDVLDSLAAVAGRRGTSGTALVVDEVLGEVIDGVFEGGWQPAEVVRAVRRRSHDAHAALLCTALTAYHSTLVAEPPERWSAQLRALGVGDRWWGEGRDWLGPWALRNGLAWNAALEVVVRVLSALWRLPPTKTLIDPPSQWGRASLLGHRTKAHVDDAILAKVRALLAKAESTSFEHEADALTAKAQELIARHSIDEALANQSSTQPREAPEGRRIPVDDPYCNAKSALLGVIAQTNGVRAVWDRVHALMTLIGFEADVDAVEVLFTSLLMQASRSMLATGQVRDGRGRSRTRSFRQSFYVAFAQRIGERLDAAARQARSTAEADLGVDLLPVLAGRQEEVDESMARMFPRLGRAKRSTVTNRDGWLAGRAAAERATLGPLRRPIESSTA